MGDKKGISPLIATVLIIGFTIALAVVIMSWGSDLVKRMTTEQSNLAESKLRCVNLDFEISKVSCDTGVSVIIDNLKSQEPIKFFTIRMHESDGGVVTVSTNGSDTPGVEAGGLVTFDNLAVGDGSFGKMDVIPVLEAKDGSNIICTEGIKTRLNLDCDI